MSSGSTATPPQTSAAPGKGARWRYRLYVLLMGLALTEGALRMMAYRPYRIQPFSLAAEPAGYLMPDSLLGMRLGEGSFALLVNEGLRFTATHRQGRRWTGPAPAQGPVVALYGCSYAYGYGLPDTASLGWRLQAARPDLRIRCEAVPGYGTVQGWLQLRTALASGDTPQVAVFAYASFHDDRNSLSPAYRQALTLGWGDQPPAYAARTFRYPYVWAADSGLRLAWCPWERLYRSWPLRHHSALVNALQTAWETWQPARNRRAALTLKLFQQIHRRCQAAGVDLLVAGLTRDAATE
ncbi:MAG: hypothetical protein D6722_20810, partial [Bacteroidetes bacterium]